MTNSFTIFPPGILSFSTLARCIAEYRKMPSLLNRFSDSSQIQKIRAQVRRTLAELVKEAKNRMRLAPRASKAQPALIPVSRPPVQKSDKPR